MRQIKFSFGLILVMTSMIACSLPASLPFGGEAADEETPESDLEPTIAPATETSIPTDAPPPTEPPPPEPTATSSATPLPSPTALGGGDDSAGGDSDEDDPTPEDSGQPTSEPSPTSPPPEGDLPPLVEAGLPPKPGFFDVYLSAPYPDGAQVLQWRDSTINVVSVETAIHAEVDSVARAGEFVYYVDSVTGLPTRVNTAGSPEILDFATPLPGAVAYQFLSSATGDFIAWLNVMGDGSYQVSISTAYPGGGLKTFEGSIPPGVTMTMIRVTNDGQGIFYDLRPDGLGDNSTFNPRYEIYVIDTLTDENRRLPGEPACGETRVCDAHVSLDGAFLVRTLPIEIAAEPVTILNLATGTSVARFIPNMIPIAGAVYETGFPIFTPKGNLAYVVGYGPPVIREYQIVLANISTGEQRLIAELGPVLHRLLGWAGGGQYLLTTREPNLYDTFQINSETGVIRQISGLLFLGHIEVTATP